MNQRKTLIIVWIFLIAILQSCAPQPVPENQDQATPIISPVTDTPPAPIVILPTSTGTPVPPTSTPEPTATFFPEENLYTVTDQTGAIEMTIPITWTDLRTEPWINDEGKTIGTIFTAATNVDEFMKINAEGVSVSVSRHLSIGYIELLEQETERYLQFCDDTYKTRWKVEHPVYRGQYVVYGDCNGEHYAWLSVYGIVDKYASDQYVARVVGYDMIPIFGEMFRDVIMQFKVFPENLP